MYFIKSAAALIILAGGQQVVGQEVYRCQADEGVTFSQQPCGDNAEIHKILEGYSPEGGLPADSPIQFGRNNCLRRSTGTAESIIELISMANESVTGYVEFEFIRGGELLSVEKERFTLPAWQSVRLSRLGPLRIPVDNCHWRLYIVR